MLRTLLQERFVGVLTTANVSGQPYPTLVAYAVSDDLRNLVFATPKATRKYANMKENPRVAMLIDNRRNDAADIREAIAATAIGKVHQLTGNEYEQWYQTFARRHPHLREFVEAPSTALFQLTAEKYVMVNRFQNVDEISI